MVTVVKKKNKDRLIHVTETWLGIFPAKHLTLPCMTSQYMVLARHNLQMNVPLKPDTNSRDPLLDTDQNNVMLTAILTK